MAIHENKKYTLTVYNTVTHRNEEVEVTREVYQAYRRTGWGIENNDASFFAHEIQMSGLIGGEEGAYENFKEFIDTENIPDNTVLKIVEIEALRKAISVLPDADKALIRALIVSRFFRKNKSNRLVSGSQPAMISDSRSFSSLKR